MENNELFYAWINLMKYHDRILKTIDYTLQDHFQVGMKEFLLLYSLKESKQNKMKLSDLVPKVGLSHSALSRMVTRMENQRGRPVIKRQTNREDKRSVSIILMGEGERLVFQMQRLINKRLKAQMATKDIVNIKRLVE